MKWYLHMQTNCDTMDILSPSRVWFTLTKKDSNVAIFIVNLISYNATSSFEKAFPECSAFTVTKVMKCHSSLFNKEDCHLSWRLFTVLRLAISIKGQDLAVKPRGKLMVSRREWVMDITDKPHGQFGMGWKWTSSASVKVIQMAISTTTPVQRCTKAILIMFHPWQKCTRKSPKFPKKAFLGILCRWTGLCGDCFVLQLHAYAHMNIGF